MAPRGRVDLYAVARILRHSDPKITFETYAHLVPGYLHGADRSLAEAREICCIRGNQALLESCPRGAFSGFGASCSTKDHVGSDSSQSQVFAPFTEDFADRLRTLLSVMDVAERLAVSTKTVYALGASGTLRHFRVLNAIRVAPADLEAYLLAART